MVSVKLSAIFVVIFVGIYGRSVSSQSINTPEVPCWNNDDCRPPLMPVNASCVSGRCVCWNDEKNYTSCRLPTQTRSAAQNPVIGHTCKLDRDCESIPNVICNKTVSQCACNSGFVLSNASTSCLPVLDSVGASCIESVQCSVLNTTCQNDQCVCSAGFHHSGKSCWKTAGIEHPCTKNEECDNIPNAVCNATSICGCDENSVLNDDRQRCLPVAKNMMDACVESVQCSKKFSNAECIGKMCGCKPNDHFVLSLPGCVITKHLGAGCSIDYECHQDQNGNSSVVPQRCVANVCTCNENFVRDGDKCVNSGGSTLGPFFGIILFALLFVRS